MAWSIDQIDRLRGWWAGGAAVALTGRTRTADGPTWCALGDPAANQSEDNVAAARQHRAARACVRVCVWEVAKPWAVNRRTSLL